MKIGDKVVCVDDGPCQCNQNGILSCGIKLPITLGVIYLVTGFRQHSVDGELMLGIGGVPDIKLEGHADGTFYRASRFRLLDHLKERTTQQKEKEGVL